MDEQNEYLGESKYIKIGIGETRTIHFTSMGVLDDNPNRKFESYVFQTNEETEYGSFKVFSTNAEIVHQLNKIINENGGEADITLSRISLGTADIEGNERSKYIINKSVLDGHFWTGDESLIPEIKRNLYTEIVESSAKIMMEKLDKLDKGKFVAFKPAKLQGLTSAIRSRIEEIDAAKKYRLFQRENVLFVVYR